MCYDISFTVDIKEIRDYFPELIWDDQIKIDFGQSVHLMGHSYGEQPVIFRDRTDNLQHLKLMEWGCIPYYVKDETAHLPLRANMLNARSERILNDPKSYWYKIRNSRCLVPITGFYEHHKVPKFKKKVPYYITLKSQQMFFVPGLYSVVELPDKETGEIVRRFTYTMITRAANTVMKAIHNEGANQGRMLLMLPLQESKKWLDENLSDSEYDALLNIEMPAEELEYEPVWTIRGREERPDGKEKNAPYQWPDLPALELI